MSDAPEQVASDPVKLLSLWNAARDVHGVLELDLDGRILSANPLLLSILGYEEEEVVGRHHRMLCDPSYTATSEYEDFWRQLKAGEPWIGEFKRIAKGGREVWLKASYCTARDGAGEPCCVVCFATDITEAVRKEAEYAARLSAIDRTNGVLEMALDGTILAGNENYARILGCQVSDLIGRKHMEFVDAAFARSPDYQAFWSRLAAGGSQSGEFRRVGNRGRVLWLGASYNPVLDGCGRPAKVVMIASDVTASRIRSIENEGRLEALGRSMGLFEFSVSGCLIEANEIACRMFGYNRGELIGRHHSVLCDPDYAASPAYQAFWSNVAKGSVEIGRHRRVAKDGQEVWVQATYNPIHTPDGALAKIMKVATDVTREVDNEMKLAALSLSDGLTGLANRRHFDETLEQEWRRAARGGRNIALLMIDVDRFKGINDAYGHMQGDAVLRRLGDIIRGAIRRPGDLGARYGGEEFAVILPDTERPAASALAEVIRGQSEAALSDAHPRFTVSAGIASMVPVPRSQPGGLVEAADKALYRAKAEGRNRIQAAF